MRKLVEHIEHAVLSPIMRAILDEVVGPHVIAIFRSQADARSVRQPKAAALRLLLGTFNPSRRQIRSTRLLLTSQPTSRSKAAILR